MASRTIELAEAITAHLAASPLLANVSVQRANFVALRAEELLLPVLYVTPVSIATAIETRSAWTDRLTFGLTLAQTLNTMGINEQDTLVEISERIPRELIDFTSAGSYLDEISEETSRVVFDEVEMETGTIFLAQITVNFRSEE